MNSPVIRLSAIQRWASLLVIVITVGGVIGGFVLRTRIIDAVRRYDNPENGIIAQVPTGWILQENTGEFVFRVQDALAIPFKTAIQVSLTPVGPDGLVADVINNLLINRAVQYTTFRELARTPIQLPNGVQGQEVIYAYANVEINPFLQSEPLIVRALDVVVLRPGQALIITYEADANNFEANRRYFDNFLATLQFQ